MLLTNSWTKGVLGSLQTKMSSSFGFTLLLTWQIIWPMIMCRFTQYVLCILVRDYHLHIIGSAIFLLEILIHLNLIYDSISQVFMLIPHFQLTHWYELSEWLIYFQFYTISQHWVDAVYWYLPIKQNSWGQHGAHLGPVGPRWAPDWPHGPCYKGMPVMVKCEVYIVSW